VSGSLVHVISLGAGVQSSTMALMDAHREIEPMPTAAIFADTQAEPASVYKWLEWLEHRLPFPVQRVSRGNLTKSALTLVKRKDGLGYWANADIPAFTLNADGSSGMIPRQCTYKFKVEVIDRAVRKLASVKRGQTTLAAVQWIGISLDEAHRMKSPRHPWANFRYPLVDLRMKRHDCLRWIERHGYPTSPRSACVYCPYHSDGEWRHMRDHEPEACAEAVRVDKELRKVRSKIYKINSVPYLHNSRVPLDQVDFQQTPTAASKLSAVLVTIARGCAAYENLQILLDAKSRSMSPSR